MSITLQSATRDNGNVVLTFAIAQPQPPPDPLSGVQVPVGPQLVLLSIPLALLAPLTGPQKRAYIIASLKAHLQPPPITTADIALSPGDVINLP